MTNKTFIPAFKASVGDWDYYICTMKYAEAARHINFAWELGGNADLNRLIQRGIGKRTDDIRDYLLKSEHRFLGALIVAAWGGDPDYTPLTMDDPNGYLSGLDRQFGVLTFDGTQSYFALDGQHRLKAIKEAIKVDPKIGREDICIIMVSHYDSEDGKVRTRRLFTNINRNAKATTGAENIVLDEDDGAAIVTRRLVTEHPFLSRKGVVKVFTMQGEEGELKLAPGNVPQSDKAAWSTLSTLYDMVSHLSFDLDPSMQKRSARPSDQVLESSYEIISKRIDDLLRAAGDIPLVMPDGVNARDIRAPKGKEGEGAAFLRPVIQKAVTRVIRNLVSQEVLGWTDAMARLSSLNWNIAAPPWVAVFNPTNSKMITAKENVELLDELVEAHLAAGSKQAIARARKRFKEVRGQTYPVGEEYLQQNLVAHEKKLFSAPTELADVGGEAFE
jgi:DNA sulfur modification protein DndB